MATEYTVALKNGVSGPARQAKADAVDLKKTLSDLENRKQNQREQLAGMRAFRQADRERRNVAFRSLQRQQREEERFTRYRISLDQKAYREQTRLASRAAAVQIREHQRAASARAAISKENRGNALDVIKGGAIGAGAAIVAGGVKALSYIGAQAIETTKLLEGAKMTLGALYKDQAKADRTITDIYKFAKLTKFESPELITTITRIASVVDDDYQQRALLGAMSDAATLYRLSGEDLNRAFVNIQQAYSAGHVESKDLREFIHALPGFKGDEMKVVLAEMIGIQAKNKEETLAKVDKAISAGQVGPKALVSAFEKTMLQATGESKLGAYAEKMGDTLEGVISNVKSGLGDLFGLAGVEKWPAMAQLKEELKAISVLMDPTTEKGKKLTASLMQMSTMVQPVIRFGAALIKLFAYLASKPLVMELIGRGVRQLGVALLFVGGVVAAAIGWWFALFGAIEYGLQKLIEFQIAAASWGANIIDGIINGIKGGISRLATAVKSIPDTIKQTVTSGLQIHSPSQVAMMYGAYTTEGFARGIERGNGRVASASRAMTGAAMGGMGGGGGGGGTLSLTVIQNITANRGDDLEALAEKTSMMTAATVRRELERCFGMSLQMGTA